MDQSLKNISIVLVDTRTPANIGAVARSMMNMGLSRLLLVRPPRDPGSDARRLAAGADRILGAARVFPSLAEAVVDQALVFGATRHPGKLRKNMTGPREAAVGALSVAAAAPVSIVFGNEVNGLENDDLRLCHEFVSIPSSPAFPSLNLSHAVMIVAYELFLASCSGGVRPAQSQPAAHAELEQFYIHLRETLERIGFLDPDRADRMMFSLRQLFSRALPDSRDVKILRGILTAVERSAAPQKTR